MNVPIQPVPPVNATITIQPVSITAPNKDPQQPQNPLANLANGTTVEGFVVNRDGQNNPILRTPIGDLKVTSEVFLKTGSEVIIKVDASQNSLARILTVDGLSPQDYSAQTARGITRDTITSSVLQPLLNSAQPAKGNLPPNAPILQAIILPTQAQPASLLASALATAQSGPASVLAQLTQLRAGTPLRLALLDLKLPPMPVSLSNIPENNKLDSFMPPPRPASGQVQQTIRQTEGQPVTAGYKPISGVQNQQSQPQEIAAPDLFPVMEDEQQPLKTQQPLQQQVLNAKLEKESPDALLIKSAVVQSETKPVATQQLQTAAPQNPVTTLQATAAQQPSAPQAQPQINQPTAPNQLVANVIGHEADGANILHTPFASLKVYTAQPLPTGTTLLLQADIDPAQTAQPVSANAPAAVTAPTTPLQSVAANLTAELSSFSEVLNWLQANHPELARDLQARLPNVSNRLASSMLSFIAAIKGGDVGELLGRRALRVLEQNVPEILARLRQNVGQMQVNLIDSPLPHWSVIPLPIYFGQEIHQAQLYISKEPPDSEKQKAAQNQGQRFILELELSELGPMQFDGFIKNRPTSKSFDLMVRTADALPNEVNQGIRSIFDTSMQITGVQGQVIFQHGRQHFVKPLAEAPRTTFGDGANTILA